MFHNDNSVLCISLLQRTSLGVGGGGGCLTQVPIELSDHRTKVEGRQAACLKERAERVLSGRKRKDSPCAD